MYEKVPRRFMPVLWFEQHVMATKTVSNLVQLILIAPAAGQVLGAIFLLLGVMLCLSTCLCNKVPQLDKKTESRKTTHLPESSPLMKN